MKFIILLMFVSLATGEDDFICCTPDEQFEMLTGGMVVTNTNGTVHEAEPDNVLPCNSGHPNVFGINDYSQQMKTSFSRTRLLAKVSLDKMKQMTNLDIRMRTSGKTTFVRILNDYKQHISYTIENDTCINSTLPEQCPRLCVPAGLPKTLSSYYGTQDHQFMVDVYKINFIVRGYLSVAPIGPKLCVPVNLVGEVHKGPDSGMGTIGFFNYTKGIKDPRVFVVPPECKNTTLTQLPLTFAGRLRRSIFY